MSQALKPLTKTGKPVVFVPNLAEKERILKRAARDGNYYAALALKQLRALSVGAVHNSNVYIPNLISSKASTFQVFSIYLPGIKADLERRSNDTYIVVNMELDPSYSAAAKVQYKPGIYECESAGGNSMTAKYRRSKKVTPEDGRSVIICDAAFEAPTVAADEVRESLGEIAGDAVQNRGKFDIYYTPQDSVPNGMKRFNASKNTGAYMHAGILAQAMEEARKNSGIFWASVGSGSAILVQSLDILHHRNVSFEGKQHALRFINPTTDPREVINKSKNIGLNIHATKTLQGGTRKVQLYHSLSKRRRAADKQDPYNYTQLGSEIAQGVFTASSGVGAATLLMSAAISSPALLMAGTVTSIIGATGFTAGYIKKWFVK